MLKHLLFDNDGTIVDSEIIAVRVMLRHLHAHGLSISEDEYCRNFPGLREREILQVLRTNYGMNLPDSFLHDTRTEYIAHFNRELRAIPGMTSLFRRLRTPKSMVSNGSVRHVIRSLKKVRLHSALDGQVFSAEQVERPKPFPDVYHYALAVLCLQPEEVMVVEDSPTGVRAAKEAGIRVVGFLGAAHVPSGHAEQLLEAGADFIAPDAKTLGLILQNNGAL